MSRIAEDRRAPGSSARIALSFACVFAGWAAGLAAYVGSQVHGSGFGYVTDLEALRLWSGMFSFVAWLAVVVPLVAYVEPCRWMFRWPWAPAFGAICAVALLALLLVPFGAEGLWTRPLFLAQAAITGGLAWGLYALASRPLERSGAGPRSAALLFATPPLALALFAYGAWPLLERVAPAVAYRYGESDTRARLYERALRELRVGDSLADLRGRVPGAFPVVPQNASGYLASGALYRLDVKEGRVRRIEIAER